MADHRYHQPGYTHNQNPVSPAPVPAGAAPALPTAGPGPVPLPPTPGPGDVQGKLAPEEMAELDSLITPRLAFLLVKAYPPAFEVMRVFFGDDLMQTQGLPQPAVPVPGPGGPAAPTSGLAGGPAPVPQVPIPQGR